MATPIRDNSVLVDDVPLSTQVIFPPVPPPQPELFRTVRRKRAQIELDAEAQRLGFPNIIARSPCMMQMFARIRRIAPYYRSVLITGPTGTGKDLLARAFHDLSPVASGRFVVVNCSAIVESLFESELFGYVKGAFTGAHHDKPGLFEYASEGTLFLDEIGDMPLTMQAKLLRVLQTQEIQRVGSLATRKVDVRVIAATNQPLERMIAGRKFREDLYYRLSMVEVKAPPLAKRTGDLPLLEKHFLRRFALQYRKDLQGFSPSALVCLAAQPWPGNIRELENVVGHAALMAEGTTIELRDLPEYVVKNRR